MLALHIYRVSLVLVVTVGLLRSAAGLPIFLLRVSHGAAAWILAPLNNADTSRLAGVAGGENVGQIFILYRLQN